MYYLIEYSDNFKDSVSFKSKIKTTGNTSANGNTKDDEMIVSLKYLNNSWRAHYLILKLKVQEDLQ